MPFGNEDWQLSFLYPVFKFENVTLLLWFLIMDHVSRKPSIECSKRKKKPNLLSWKWQSMKREAAFLEMSNLWLKQEAPVGHHKGSFKQGWRLGGVFIWLGAFGRRVLASEAEEWPNHFKPCKLSSWTNAINYVSTPRRANLPFLIERFCVALQKI